MKKIQFFFKRIVASLLICFILSYSSLGNYVVATVPVQASSLTAGILSSLIEAVMLSMGLSFSSTSDLNNAVTGLNNAMSNNPTYEYKGVEIFTLIKEALQTAKIGASVALPMVCAEWLCNYLYSNVEDSLSASVDVSNPVLSGTSFTYCDFTTVDWGAVFERGFTPSHEYWDRNNLIVPHSSIISIVTTSHLTGAKSFIFIDNGAPFVLLEDCEYYVDAGQDFDVSNDSGRINKAFHLYEYSSYYEDYIDYNGLGNVLYFNTSDKTVSVARSDSSSYYSYGAISSSTNASINYVNNRYMIPAFSDEVSIQVFINEGTKICSSFEEYEIYTYSEFLKPTSTVYGLTQSAKSFEKNKEDETYYDIQLLEASITSRVEQSVTNALAANPSITDAELNAAISDIIASQNGIIDSVETNTTTLSTLLTSILSSVRFIAEDVAAIATGRADSGTVEDDDETVGVIIPTLDLMSKTLTDISTSVNNIFVIDTSAIDIAVSGFDTLWSEKLPFIDKLSPMLEELSFSENYDYPVIKMQTPQILNTFYKEEYIVLCDFEDYATYCLWCRNLVRALLWFSFGFSLINHLKTNFNVG